MRIEQKGFIITFGTSDAPAPKEAVPVGSPVPVMACVESTGGKNAAPVESLELVYRVKDGPPQTVVAGHMWKSPGGKGSYFRATIPPQNPGDRVDYTFRLGAGDERPLFTVAGTFGSFVTASDAKPHASPPPESTVKPGVAGAKMKTEALAGGRSPDPAKVAPAQESSPPRHPAKPARLKTTDRHLSASSGPAPAPTPSQLRGPYTPPKVSFAEILGAWAENHAPIVKAVAANPGITSLRDVALQFNTATLAGLVEPAAIPANTPGTSLEEKKRNFAQSLQRKLFNAHPGAVLQRMLQNAEVPIADPNVRTGVANFLGNQPEFNIRTTSVLTALKHPQAFKNIREEHRPAVVDQLKTLQRVQALAPIPEAVPVLMKANLTSAFHVGEMPESTFLAAHGKALGEEVAKQVYTHAINTRIRNEHALMTMRESIKGTGLAVIDGPDSLEARMIKMQTVASKHSLDLQTLFGSIDNCECDDCLSVYSPASYYVETLNFLRNNNLGPDPATGGFNPNIHTGIQNTPLEKLFRRRPDLGCLELTCENTFTVLPYVDLVNEVMESFVVHLSLYHSDSHVPKQATLDFFNVGDETTSELLAQPQHINYDAYCILKDAVYPFTLPYHQPIDSARISLNYLGTSRYELQDTFRSAPAMCTDTTLSAADLLELQSLHKTILDRAVDAEFVGLTQEEYIILVKEAFWPKRYFDITLKTTFSVDQYRQKIGVKQVYEYYGYGTESDMLSLDEGATTGQLGLTFVKLQLLPRSGLEYTDLVELLKTRFINPLFPQGDALTTLESIRFSYRFLQTLVDAAAPTPQGRFAKLIEFLEKAGPLVAEIQSKLHPDPCRVRKPVDSCEDIRALGEWVYCYFDRVGKLIVLESGEGPQLPFEGEIVLDREEVVGTLRNDGTILNNSGKVVAHVLVNGKISGSNDWTGFSGTLFIRDASRKWVGFIDAQGLHGENERLVTWLPPQDTCNPDKVRLTHLDGTPVTVVEYDRMQRFIRLWRKLGWTMDDLDKALIGLSANSNPAAGGCQYVVFDAFAPSCGSPMSDVAPGCPPINQFKLQDEITPWFIHQLVAVKKLLDSTGLPLPKLLAFWADMSTDGDQSLYATLFLKHNVLGIDTIFEPDVHGDYLTQAAKISDHLPVLLAALKLKAGDVPAIMTFPPALPDELTLHNVTVLYRCGLLAKVLHLKVPDLAAVIALFGAPFASASQTLSFLNTWGLMEDAGFTLQQLNYIILNQDNPTRPLEPSQKKILQIAKTLYDGLNQIDTDNPDITNEVDATSDLVRSKTGLLFSSEVVDQILGLLQGTTLYSTNAPPGLTVAINDPQSLLAKRIKYIPAKDPSTGDAILQVTGILTDSEVSQAKALASGSQGWADAIDRIGRQSDNIQHVFNSALSGIFTDVTAAKAVLLAGDDPAPDGTLPVNKAFYFMQAFMPFLRPQLEYRFINDTMSALVGLAGDVTNVLLSEILVVGSPAESAILALDKIKDKRAASGSNWSGYLIPPTDGIYTFVAISDTQPAPLSLDGETITFNYQQEDPSNVWSTDPTLNKLKKGQLYLLTTTGLSTAQLQWRTATTAISAIPTTALLPDYSQAGTKEAFVKLYKAALIVSGFNLSADEVAFLQLHHADFAGLDFNGITLTHWLRLQAYTSLRDNLPQTSTSLLDLFTWAGKPDSTSISSKIADATNWKPADIDQLIAPGHFDLNRPDAFRNEVNLVLLSKSLAVAGKIGMDINRLFDWAKPGSKFPVSLQIAEDIRSAIRSRFDQSDWEQVIKPLNDELREHQKLALISYLLVQQDLIDWGVEDADSLFEFLLIDVQMDPCMQTSRIKQAISSVQSFIQRCILGLEDQTDQNGVQIGVPISAIDRDRWAWMQKYRVWEANRKVFLYPENWIDPELRDDKSPFYQELESELMQKDVNTQTVEDALKNYLFKVDEVASLHVAGLYYDDVGGIVHVFGRTQNAPYHFFYRHYDINAQNWTSWTTMQVDITSYDVEHTPTEPQSGKFWESETGFYRLYNKSTDAYFYTTDANERAAAIANDGFTSQGVQCDVLQSQESSSVPLYRLNNGNGYHYYTTSAADRDIQIQAGWTDEGTSCFVFNEAGENRIPLYHCLNKTNGQSMLYTTVYSEYQLAISDNGGYDDWGIACYVVPAEHFTENGTYLIPMMLDNRLFAFFPQFAKKTGPSTSTSGKTFKDLGDQGTDSASPMEYWEIKMSWSEYRNGKWTQKQVSKTSIQDLGTDGLPDIRFYTFVPRVVGSNPNSSIEIDVYYWNQSDSIGAFGLKMNQLDTQDPSVSSNPFSSTKFDFHYENSAEIYSFQASGAGSPLYVNSVPYFDSEQAKLAVPNQTPFNFSHAFIHSLLSAVNTSNLDNLFAYYLNGYLNNSFDLADAYGGDDMASTPLANCNELRRPYSLANWEAGFHAPMHLVNRMLASQQFDQALTMCHYVFDPSAKGSDDKRYWQFPPFKEVDAENVLENLFLGLKPGQANAPINEWRNNPFQPHVVARSRPSAYMKWVVMKYIEILIEYGDYYFRQNTLETIPLAIQCYILASHLYGPAAQKIPKRGIVEPETYNSLLDKWDAFGNAMVELELAFPFSNQTPFPIGVSNGVVGLANIFGFATSLYFCIPDNPQLTSLRTTIDDRLFKIRHCEDINGVFRQLPLFEPPIDPGLLIQAAAEGLNLSDVLNDLNSPAPNYRFNYLLQKSLELCAELKSLGNAFLSAKEKGDAEALSQLRAGHETSIQNLLMEVKKQQVDEANKTLEALQQNRKVPVYRLQYYLSLIGQDLSSVPDSDTDFNEVANQIEQPVSESGLQLISLEKEELDKGNDAANWQIGIGVVETLAGVFHALPTMKAGGSPLGVGLDVLWGFPNLANAISATARGLKVYADYLSYQSSSAGRKGGFLRQLQDRVQQANVAGYEIKNIDKQILTQQIRINIANQEITNQQKQIDNAQEVEEFLRNKYTNQELYTWMEGNIRTLYYQAYTLTYDLAKKADKLFSFERGLDSANFIQFGYWDAAHDGLLAGERMYAGLKQIEAAYLEKRGYDFEIPKFVSLRQVNPLALLQLRSSGICEFELPEILFDMDRPGDYLRRIKSIALTVPCVVGPYTSLNCTLRLLSHSYRTSAIATGSNDYPQVMDAADGDSRFSTANVPIASIAVSSGQNDSGVFELNFRDERYLPFEGAGVISKWRLEFPADFRQFDYNTITDVLMQIRYTSVDGGDKLAKAASGSVQDYIKGVVDLSQQEGLFAAFDLVHDFSNDWYKFLNPATNATQRSLALNNLNDRLPIFTRGRLPKNIQATDLYLLTSATFLPDPSALTLVQSDGAFGLGPKYGNLNLYAINDLSPGIPMDNWQLNVTDLTTKIPDMWLVVKYRLQP